MTATTTNQSSIPVDSTSSLTTNNPSTGTTTVQSGPYTKAQFYSTMEGSRSVKNIKEIEQLLRDYPTALELYRTGRYKVKVKYEADVERVILVEKRISKTKTDNIQQSNQTVSESSQTIDKISTDLVEKQENIEQLSTITDNNSLAQLATSSIPPTNLIQSNVEQQQQQQQIESNERDVSVSSHQRKSHHRSRSRDSSSHSKPKDRKSHRNHPNTIVPYASTNYSTRNSWQQLRPVQPYYGNSVLHPQNNMYVNPNYPSQQSYHYGQKPSSTYQNQPIYPMAPTGKNINSAQNYISTSQNPYTANQTLIQPAPHQIFYPNQQQYSSQAPPPWSTNRQTHSFRHNNHNNVHFENRRSSKHRAHSVDTGPRNYPLISYNNQQPTSTVVERHHHRHRLPPTNIPMNNIIPTVEPTTQQMIPLKDTTTINNRPPIEKLTIRQLNQIFLQTNPSGRLSYNLLPNILQRFGISLIENDIMSAAQELQYNLNEPISARRAVHILIKLGKIARSAAHEKQPQQSSSPYLLPEDREVTDIMTQRRVLAAPSTHIHSSIHPNYWY